MRGIASLQKRVYTFLSTVLAPEEGSPAARSLLLLLLGSFLYGLLHALGPGHRKMTIASYFVSERATIRAGVLTGLSIAVLHALAALVIIYGIFYVVSGGLLVRFNALSFRMDQIAYGMLTAFGLALAVSHGVSFARSRNPGRRGRALVERGAGKGILLIIISGMVPCPGAAAMLTLSLSVGAAARGIVAVLAMSLGMATVLSALAVLTIVFREKVSARLEKVSHDRGRVMELIMEGSGALVMILFGLIMLLPTL